MANTLYVTAAESKSGKSAILLGIVQLLLKKVARVAIFRPIINTPPDPQTRDHDINLVLEHFDLKIPYDDTYAYTLDAARDLITKGQRLLMLETIFNKFKKLEADYDFILCEGTDLSGKDTVFECELNAEIASNLGCPVALVLKAAGKNAEAVLESAQGAMDLLDKKGADLAACMINRSSLNSDESQEVIKALADRAADGPIVVCILPEEPVLGRPTIADVCKWLGAKVLYGHKYMDNQVSRYLVAAMQGSHFLGHLTPGSLVITPGDREDILLACLSSCFSPAVPEIAGVVLTGGLDLHPAIQKLLDNWTGTLVPIISADGHTFQTMQAITQLDGKIEPGDMRKINTCIGNFEKYVDARALARRVIHHKSTKITPRNFEFYLLEQAKQELVRMVLPEGQDERILRAADALLRRGVADLIILGDPARISLTARNLGLDLGKATLLNPESAPQREDYAVTYHELRKHKGIDLEQARDIMLDPTYFGTMMVQKGHADGMVSGALNTTAHTIRPAFEIIKTKDKDSIVSSVFFMCLKDQVLVFADCAVNPNPNPQELASIAVHAAETAAIFGIEPRVAMLSYSTGTSGKGEDVDKVKEATLLAKKMAPHLLLEGPIQYDAAIDPTVASTKMPDNPVAGRATVFIFPDLNTGNNTYKAVQRAANAIAIGPVLQGLKKPVNDLSRGATVEDIINTVAITAIQAQAVKKSSANAVAPL